MTVLVSTTERLASVSLFSGAGGLDLGLEDEGFTTGVFVEVNRDCGATLEANRSLFRAPLAPILGDITTLSAEDVLGAAGLSRGEVALVAGGPPCQSFSTAGRRASVCDPRGSLFNDFVRMVEGIQPRFFVLENVRGILSAALKHRPLHLRGGSNPPLQDDEELGSFLRKLVLPALRERLGYEVVYGLVNAADYGVPQMRRRTLFIGSRDRELGSLGCWPEEMPLTEIMPPTHGAAPGLEPWPTLGDALRGLVEKRPEFVRYSAGREAVLKLVPPGKNWRHLRDTRGDGFLREVMGGAYDAGGGKVGFWRRLSFDKPSPTVPASPIQKGTCLCHPVRTRPLTVREYARVQQFPDDYVLTGSVSAKYTQIGNAVPVGLARAIGRALRRIMAGTERTSRRDVAHTGAAARS